MSQATWCPLWRYWSARIICSRNQLSRPWQAHWRRLRPRPRPLRSRPRTRAEPHTAPLPSLRPGTGSWPLLTQELATCPQWSSRPIRVFTRMVRVTPIRRPVLTTPATRRATPSDRTTRRLPPGLTCNSLGTTGGGTSAVEMAAWITGRTESENHNNMRVVRIFMNFFLIGWKSLRWEQFRNFVEDW